MTVHSSWNPRLKSVKFEFETEPTASIDAQQPPHDVVFENPIPFDIPGVPKSRLVGESCDIGTLAAKSNTDLVALISTAWALVLSQQVDGPSVEFGLSLSDDSLSVHPVHTSLDRRRAISEVLRDAAAHVEQIRSSNPSTDGLEQAGHNGDGASLFQSVLDISARGTRLDEAVPLDRPLVIGCLVDHDEQEVTFTALFEERIIQRNLLRFLLSDLEHVVWQMLQPQAAHLALKDLETIGPVSQRAMRRLNRPLQPKRDCLVQHLIASNVADRPEAPAVDAWDGTLTYARLDAQSNCLARHLVSLGVGPEVFVPIIFEKSKMSIVAMLAVVKAGGAFMPLDPRMPLSRLHSMVAQAGPSIAVSSVSCRGKMPRGVEEIILDEALLARIAAHQMDRSGCPATTATPDNVLYLMFTSGSTGKPKGVAVNHASFCSSAIGFKDAIRLASPQRRALHYASPGFDASIMETLVTLIVGACICIPSDADRLDDVAKCIVDFQVNWAFLTPPIARLLRPEDVPRLEVLCLGGEALPRDVVEIWADSVDVINAYGPTECTIVAMVSDPISRTSQSIPLGKPVGCAVWILNEEGDRIQSFNSVGEIIIEGPGVARGYLGDEVKTAAVFGEHADFLDTITSSSSRFYRTGDLGRMNVDGTIDYLGRKDTQVKVNGQRIETGEIEHHMKNILNQRDEKPALDVVVELLQPDHGSRAFLAAFVGPGEGTAPDCASKQGIFIDRVDPVSRQILERTTGIKGALSEKLPDYMIPRVILPCESIPRTSSGKTDRKRLRQTGNDLTMAQVKEIQVPTTMKGCRKHLETSKAMISTCFDDDQDEKASWTTSSDGSATQDASETSEDSTSGLPCLTPGEQFMREIWADILELPKENILPNDDFLLLGGDSIGFIKVVAACRRAGIHTTVAALASFTVLQDMARVCERSQNGAGSSSAGRRKPFGLLRQDQVVALRKEAAVQCAIDPNLVQDLYPCTHTQEDLMVANIIHPGVSIGRFNHRLPKDIDVARFKKAWESVWKDTPILRTRFTNTSAGSLQVVVDEAMPWSESHNLEAYIKADNAKPMLPGLPLSRFALVFENDKTVHFVWTMHHMLYDGWSVSLICKRVNASYRGLATEPASDFRQFVAYSRELDGKRNATYWQKKLEGVTSSTFPAPARPDHACRANRVVRDYLELPERKEQCKTTMSTMVQAAWAIMIGHFSKTTDVLFGATISGRNAPLRGIDNIEGPTMATVPVRLTVRPDSRAVDFLHSVRDHFTEMIPYEQTALKAIRAMSEDTKRGCDFQNMLVIQAGSVWGSDDEPLGEPSHRGEDATVPVLCQVWLLQSRIHFDVVFDEQITCREVVTEAIAAVKDILGQLLQLSDSSETQLANIQPGKAQETSIVSCLGPSPVKTVQATVHDLVSDVSRQQQHEEAVCTSETSVSYQEGMILPLCFEKSVWTIVAMLAALKTGAAFVLLDPSQPQQRLEELVSQVAAQFVLISPLQAMSMNFAVSLRQVIVDGAFLQTLPAARRDELPDVSPSDLAYIIFTSGAAAYSKALLLEAKRRILHFSSYSFDASLNETLVVLMHGGTVCIANEKERTQDLAGFVRRTKVDWAILTPSVARLLSPSDVPLLETLDLGGEAPDRALLSRWHQARVRVFNVYGPAEGAGTALSQQYAGGVDPRTIGFPMGCQVWIVDPSDHDKLVAGGQTGELVLEGPILANGYFKDPQKTAQSFISNPKWATQPGFGSGPRRMYKTGDLVFRKDNGAIDYVGRKDLQVKHHGQRIELGDIETNLAACSGVKRCAVFYPVAGPLKQQLVAIIEADTKEEENEAFPRQLKTELAAKVPGSMVPAHWLDAGSLAHDGQPLPLSLSGKLDRRLITAQLERLSASEADQALETSGYQDVHDDAGTGVIGEEEQPAYTIARKIHEMLPARIQAGLASKCENECPERTSFDDLTLQSSGLDSLNMMSLMYFISRQFDANVSMQLLMDKKTTIRKLANPTTIDVMAEICRHDSRVAALQRNDQASGSGMSLEQYATLGEPVTVLLTGGNGFIGTQILRQLLEHRRVSGVIAVVRGETAERARSRTIEAARRARWWTDLHGEKLQVWPGDLSLPCLGLEPAHWEHLQGGNVDIIIHNGAAVHWAKSYAALEAANVDSTVELLCLAATVPRMGFAIISPGLVVGTATEGVANIDDYIWRLAAACIRLGAYNATQADSWVELSDAATMATTIVDTAFESAIPGMAPQVVKQVYDGMKWGQFWAVLAGMGYRLEAREAAEWLASMREDIDACKESHPLWPLAHMLESQTMQEAAESWRGETPLRLKLAVRRNAEFLSSVGFLPPLTSNGQEATQGSSGGTFSRSGR
ncbi:AMP-binding enzyme domain-containing protein [Hirsutella rhossiliensis]|uniref:AMP-binding enzyme domain-containing protein n=1 Tax=Hirsutella rhossiliensis TaxID=111463 RepID=A0A9P8N772_9HYPO|nr:AMP-binding enzyme domain-containing protein [Hirsutella rhossiliensis]KAH0967034.1 AMP-binding enzyme domain-containing protein [Hirsutella rhossiliensis]